MDDVNRKTGYEDPRLTFEDLEAMTGAGVRIVGVAIRYDDVITAVMPAPNRHHNLISHIHGVTGRPVSGSAKQGFWTSTNRWVNRHDACVIARAANQLIRKTGPEDILFSEDVW